VHSLKFESFFKKRSSLISCPIVASVASSQIALLLSLGCRFRYRKERILRKRKKAQPTQLVRKTKGMGFLDFVDGLIDSLVFVKGQPDALKPFVHWMTGLVILCSIARIIVESDRLHKALKTPGSLPSSQGSLWIICTNCLNIIMLTSNVVIIKLGGSCRIENRVALFLQLAIALLVINYAGSNEGWGEQYLQIALPALGVLLDVPIVVNLSWVLLVLLFQSLLLMDRTYPFNYRQFDDVPEGVPQSISFAVAMVVSFAVAKLFSDALRKEQTMRNSNESTIVSIVDALEGMNIKSADASIEQVRLSKSNDELVSSLERLAKNLGAYRPYIPPALLLGRDQFDDDEEESDDENSDGDSIKSKGANVDEVNKGFKRRRGTVLHVCNAAFPNEAKDAAEACAKLCETVLARLDEFQGCAVSLTPNSIIVSFNGYTPCVLHEQQACRFALAVAAELHNTRLEWCIAVASGYNFVGSCGTTSQRSRFVAGENIDLVQRIPSLAIGRLNSRVVISEEVARSGSIDAVPVDIICPDWLQDGRSREITLYELRGAKKEEDSKPLATAYTSAFSAVRQGDLNQAVTMWKNYCERMPSDHQAARLLRICQAFQEQNKPLPHPFVRREVHWESFEGATDIEPPRQQLPPPAALSSEGTISDAQKALQMLESKKAVEENNEGFFTMFVAEDEDDDPPDALDGLVPKVFKDSKDNEWKRSELTIGQGAFSTVYLALGGDGIIVAMKCFSTSAKRSSNSDLVAEVNTLTTLRNDYIVGYVSFANTPHHFIILMEYVSGGSLAQLLQQFGKLPLGAVRRYVRDILHGLRYLHANNITHCDMKPHNVLLSNDGMCKLSDFGSAMNTNVEKAGGEETIVRGTSWYLAPEAARGEIKPASDVWSVGATVFELICGHHPWLGKWKGSEAQFIAELGRSEAMVPSIPSDFPPDAAEFCEACFTRDPEKRPSVANLLLKPFVT
jgi:hypothetical protein